MAGLFGASPGIAQAVQQAGTGLGEEMRSLGLFSQPRRNRGLFGTGMSREDLQARLMAAQAIVDGNPAAAAQIMARMQSSASERAEQESEAEAVRQLRTHGYQALRSRGVDAAAIGGMSPQDLSRAVADRIQLRQFGAEGGSIGTPGQDGQMTYQTAPWTRQIGRDIVSGGPNGAAPQVIHRGVEPVAVPDGGALYGMTGDGSIISGGAPAMGAPAAPEGAPVRVNSPEEARSLPPGTMFQTPDGRTMRVPGGARPSNGAQTFPSGPGWP